MWLCSPENGWTDPCAWPLVVLMRVGFISLPLLLRGSVSPLGLWNEL